MHVPHEMGEWTLPSQMTLYGLPETDWPGPRWVQSVDPPADDRGGVIFLDHGTDPWLFSRSDRWLSVATSNDSSATGAHDLARHGLILLTGLEFPPNHYSPVAPDGMSVFWVWRNRVMPLVERFDSWELTSWTVDGKSRPARVAEFTSAFVGVAAVEPGSLILAIGCGFAPNDLCLEAQDDTGRYHFDRTRPITELTCDRSRRLAFGDATIDSGPPTAHQRHPDLIQSKVVD